MKLDKKRKLAAKVLKVGIERIKFDKTRLEDIKEAITRQDIKDLLGAKAIKLKPVKGRHAVKKRKYRRGLGKIRKKIKRKKKEYIIKIRNLRKSISLLKEQGRINLREYKKLRKMAKSNQIRDRKNLMEIVREMKK